MHRGFNPHKEDCCPVHEPDDTCYTFSDNQLIKVLQLLDLTTVMNRSHLRPGF
jgi:hypothetical protein